VGEEEATVYDPDSRPKSARESACSEVFHDTEAVAVVEVEEMFESVGGIASGIIGVTETSAGVLEPIRFRAYTRIV
jgi:hypothetical protein